MTDELLPELPTPHSIRPNSGARLYTEDQLRAYAREAIRLAPVVADWRPTLSNDVDEASSEDWIWICWEGGRVDLCEGWASIDWIDTTHWAPAAFSPPAPPAGEVA